MKKTAAILILVQMMVSSCIVNDVPYPIVRAAITELTSSDAKVIPGEKNPAIDNARRTVTITLGEKMDMSRVRIDGVKFNSELVSCSTEIVGIHNLTKPMKVTLHTYQDYEWTISAVQPIERYFAIRSQVGKTVIDEANRRVIVSLNKNKSLDNVTVSKMKLGPADISTYKPAQVDIHDLSKPLQIEVSYGYDKKEIWTVYAEYAASAINFNSLDVWTSVAWLSAVATEGNTNGFRYRESGSEDWLEVGGVTDDGGSFSAKLEGLDPDKVYEFLAYSRNDEGEEETTEIMEKKTDIVEQLPNHGFNEYARVSDKDSYLSFYNPESTDPACRTKWWDNGNMGSTTIGEAYSICVPDPKDLKEGKSSAHLISRNVMGIKFAAGNLFAGEFAGLVGTSGGIVNFGQPFTHRPRAFKLWMKYICGDIDCIGTIPDDDPVKKGDSDRAHIFVLLGDWNYKDYGGTPEHPVQVNTTDKSSLLKLDGPNVIACGTREWNQSTNGWIEVEIPLVYNTTSKVPTHIIVSIASSKLGDYFTGSSASQLWVDDFRLVY